MHRLHRSSNTGLQGSLLNAIEKADPVNVTLEPMWQDWCTDVSVAVFFVAAGRWLWKTGDSCDDLNNVGFKTTIFKASA